MATTPASPPSIPSSANGYGLLWMVGILVGLGVLGGGVLWLLTGSLSSAAFLLIRLTLTAVVLPATELVSRVIFGYRPGELLTHRRAWGELSGLGLLLGFLFLPSALAPYVLPNPVGQPMEIAGPTLEGGRFDLNQHRGRVVVVDFWATWCGPCVTELPNVRTVYDEFHDRGVDFVSVSLDRKREDLVRFLQTNPIPWPQIFFDPAQPPSQEMHPAERYGVDTIPCLMVIDREGKLVQRGVRGSAIRVAVARALGESASVNAGERVQEVAQWMLNAPFYSVLAAPWWLLGGCTLGGTLGAGLVQAGARRLLRRPLSTVTSSP